MLIQALCDYADKAAAKSADSQIPSGYSQQTVHFEVLLTAEGKIAEIVDLREAKNIVLKNGKTKTVTEPSSAVLPERSAKTGIDSAIIEHRPLYLFGLNYEKDGFTPDDKTNKARKSHQAFVERNSGFFADLDSEICKAYYNFIVNWNPDEEKENPCLKALGKAYQGSYFCFGLDGKPDVKLHRDEQFNAKYRAQLAQADNEDEGAVEAVCPIMGEKLPVARIHDKIKFPGGNTTGCVLVGMKEDAYSSYGKTQSYNSGISVVAMKKYTATFNKLLADKNHHITIQDMTVVFFAMKADDSAECDFFAQLFGGDGSEDTNKAVQSVLKQAAGGVVGELSAFGMDKDVVFCIAGLTPNSSRICQKFFYRNRFGKIVENLVQHQRDMAVNDSGHQFYFSTIAKELVSPKAKDAKLPPPLLADIMQAAFSGSGYPYAMLENAVRRIKTDSDDDKSHYIKFNDTRIGIIKACLNRKARLNGQKEEITMSLNAQSTDAAYVCGRLFAVLEKIQQESTDVKLNRTIRDSFFSSACTEPALVFPKLIRTAQYHLSHIGKKNENRQIFFQKLLGEIVDGLDGAFPKTLSLEEQGSMEIGYYHQNRAFYLSKADKNDTEETDCERN